MELKKVWIMVMMVMLGEWCCDACWKHERIALFRIKNSFINYTNTMSHIVSDWGEDADCCNWRGVECNTTTWRVNTIDLSNATNWGLGDVYLNASLLLPFEELKTLYLGGNNIARCLENEGLERLSTLANLEILDLRDNSFDNSILSSLHHLSFLKYLDLGNNKLNGFIDIGGLNNLTYLRRLDLGGNAIEGFKSGNGLMLTNLEELYLDGNQFDTAILLSLKGLSSLRRLGIGYNQLKGVIDLKDLDELRNLERLDLSGNEINKFIFSNDIMSLKNLSTVRLNNLTTNEGSIRIESLGYIESLDLGNNNLEGSIFGEELDNMSNLKKLYLGTESRGAYGPYLSMNENSLKSIGSLTSLEVLRMNHMKTISPIEGFPNLRNLEALDISYSTLDSNFLQYIAKWAPSLKTLRLSGCGLNGTIPRDEGLCELKHLQTLDVSSNHFSGIIPWCLANLTSLQQLDLSQNQFMGNLRASPLESLTSLQFVNLSYNLFEIPMSFSPFFNLSNLKSLYATNNKVYGEIGSPNLTPKFQLVNLSLSDNGYIGEFPKFLYHQSDLNFVDLSNNKVRGGFPNWLLDNNTLLWALFLANNSLYGPFQLPTQPHNLQILDVSKNCFDGPIPKSIGAYFPGLTFLSMSDSCLNGGIPSSFGNISHLRGLDLSNNSISGSFEFYFGHSLSYVYLSKNKLTGSFLNAFFPCINLVELDLSHNSLTGGIPSWINRFYYLEFLLLRDNNFEDGITVQFCNLNHLRLIDLSHNNFSGQIPHCLTFRSSRFSPINTCMVTLEFITKSILYSYRERMLIYFSGLDLSCNNFEGDIPSKISDLNQIQVLNLSHNHLSGPIPQTFFNLSQVESLDISYNRLNGTIPHQLTQLHALAFFSVAYNNLSGKTPETEAQFATFNESSYEGNHFLCGWPLSRSCDDVMPPLSTPRPLNNDNKDDGFIDMGVFFVSFLVSYFMVLFAISTILYINPYWRQAWFYYIEVGINNYLYTFLDAFSVLFKFRGL